MNEDFGALDRKPEVRWKIECRTGKHVEQFSAKPHQEEALIPPDRVFRVIEKHTLEDGRLFIHLREEP